MREWHPKVFRRRRVGALVLTLAVLTEFGLAIPIDYGCRLGFLLASSKGQIIWESTNSGRHVEQRTLSLGSSVDMSRCSCKGKDQARGIGDTR